MPNAYNDDNTVINARHSKGVPHRGFTRRGSHAMVSATDIVNPTTGLPIGARVGTVLLAASMTLGGGAASVMVAQAATPDDSKPASAHTVITSARSFKGTNDRSGRSDLLSESVSVSTTDETPAASRDAVRTEVSNDVSWGGIEELNIPQTRSTEEKNAGQSLHTAIDDGNKKLSDSEGKVADDKTRDALKSAIDEASKVVDDVKVPADQLAAAELKIKTASSSVDDSIKARNDALAAAQLAASRRSSRGSNGYTFTYKLPEGKSSSEVVNFAMQFVGKVPYVWAGSTTSGWDCSGFVMYVYAHFGIGLPHYSGAQATMGSPVSDLSKAKPGDIIANSQHAAIYIGNGLVVNALNPSAGTTVTPVQWAFSGGYQIRRLVS